MIVKWSGYNWGQETELKSEGRDRGWVNEQFMEITLVFIYYIAHMLSFLEIKRCLFPLIVNCINYLSLRSGCLFSVLCGVGVLYELSSLGCKEKIFRIEYSGNIFPIKKVTEYHCARQNNATSISNLQNLWTCHLSWQNGLCRWDLVKDFEMGRLACIIQVVHAKLLQSCLTLCDTMDCSPRGSSVHGIFQARILEWIAISFSRWFQVDPM